MLRLITGSASSHVCALFCLILAIGLTVPAFATGQPTQIILDASMISVEPGVGLADENELVDEQDAYPGGAGSTSWENWGNPVYPQSVYLDLGQEYEINEVHLFNHGGDGDFHVSAGSPGNWVILVGAAIPG